MLSHGELRRSRPIRIVGLQPQDSDSHQSKKKSANIDSNEVEETGDGVAGVAACDGAARLQAEQCSLTARPDVIGHTRPEYDRSGS